MFSEYKIIDPRTIYNYNALLLKSEDYSIFHTSNWTQVLCDTYNYLPTYIVKENDNSFDALWPIMFVNSCLTGKRLVSLTFSDFCEPIFSQTNPQEFDRTLGKLLELGDKKKVKYIEFNTSKDIMSDSIPRKVVFGHVLDLTKSVDELISNQRKGTKTSTSKAKKNNLRIQIDNSQSSLLNYFELHCITRKRLGLPPQPFLFFKLILKHLLQKNMGFITLAFKDNKCISGAIFLFFGNKAIYKFSASDERYRDLKPNNLVLWESILHCKELNLNQLHFGRTDEHHQGLRTYKRGWGGEEILIKYYKYSVSDQSFIKDKSLNPENYYNLFRALPIPFLRGIGKLIYRHFG